MRGPGTQNPGGSVAVQSTAATLGSREQLAFGLDRLPQESNSIGHLCPSSSQDINKFTKSPESLQRGGPPPVQQESSVGEIPAQVGKGGSVGGSVAVSSQ